MTSQGVDSISRDMGDKAATLVGNTRITRTGESLFVPHGREETKEESPRGRGRGCQFQRKEVTTF